MKILLIFDILCKETSKKYKKNIKASHLNSLFHINRRLCYEKVTQQEQRGNCKVPLKNIFGHFSKIFGNIGESSKIEDTKFDIEGSISNSSQFEDLVKPLTSEEIKETFAKANTGSAPGPDGITLRILRWVDPSGEHLSELF